MRMMIVPFTNSYSKARFEEILDEEQVKQVFWIQALGSDGIREEDKPQIVGSLMALLGYEEQEVAYIFVNGNEKASRIAARIKQLDTQETNRVFSVPLTVM